MRKPPRSCSLGGFLVLRCPFLSARGRLKLYFLRLRQMPKPIAATPMTTATIAIVKLVVSPVLGTLVFVVVPVLETGVGVELVTVLVVVSEA